jgi:Ni/Co efflux regulator RcnB
MRFGMSNRMTTPRHSGVAASALIWMAVMCVSVASAQQDGRQQGTGKTQGRTERVIVDGKIVRDDRQQEAGTTQGRTERTIIDGKEVRRDSDPAALRAGRDTVVKWEDGRRRGAIKAKNAELTADLTDVKFIRAGGYLSIEETRDGMTRRFQAEPGKDGKINRAYTVNGEAHEFDAEAKQWLGRILNEFFDDVTRRKQ